MASESLKKLMTESKSKQGEHGVRPYNTLFLVGANPVFALL
jgi:hypothetical protein